MSTAFSYLLVLAEDPVPEDNDVVAGWIGFGVFIFLILATALILWAFTRQIRRVNQNAKDGVFYDPEAGDPDDEESPDAP